MIKKIKNIKFPVLKMEDFKGLKPGELFKFKKSEPVSCESFFNKPVVCVRRFLWEGEINPNVNLPYEPNSFKEAVLKYLSGENNKVVLNSDKTTVIGHAKAVSADSVFVALDDTITFEKIANPVAFFDTEVFTNDSGELSVLEISNISIASWDELPVEDRLKSLERDFKRI